MEYKKKQQFKKKTNTSLVNWVKFEKKKQHSQTFSL